jgi:RNA polymerase sigma-70 factor, ECF subfamily
LDLETAVAGASLPVDEDAEATIAARCLRPIVETLATTDRDAIDWIELQGMTQRQAAELAGISLTAMKARVQRARRRLKAALLECCQFVLDARGGVIECASRAPSGRACAGTAKGKECHDA